MDNNSNTAASIFYMISGMAILGFIDNFVVVISPEVGLWQFHAVRSAIAVPTLLCVGAILGWQLWPNRFWPSFARNLFLSGAMIFYFGGLGFFPIAAVAAGLFTAPVLVMFIDAVWSKRSIGPIRLLFAVIGFAATLLVLKPDVGAFGWPNLIPVIGGMLYAIGNVATRKWCEGESAVPLLWGYMAQMLVVGVLGALYFYVFPSDVDNFLTRGWVWPSASVWFWIVMQAMFSLVGIGCIMKAYLIGDVTYVSIFEYSMLIFASVTAWLVFGQAVGPWAMLGIALIILTGIVIALRSARAK
ncbi:MAG: DMT family transporter [Planktomarina sp.]